MHKSSVNNVFQVAAFNLVYGSALARIVRTVVALTLILLVIVPVTTGVQKPPYFWVSLLLIFVMFEAFYRLKLSYFEADARRSKSWHDAISLSLAKTLLKTKHWDSAGWVFASLTKNLTVAVVLTRADFSQEEIGSLAKKLTAERLNLDELMIVAYQHTHKEGGGLVSELDLLLALFEKNQILSKALFDKELKIGDLANIAFWVRGNLRQPFWERNVQTLGNGIGELWSGGWTFETEQYTQDLSEGIVKGQIDGFLVGRKKEIGQIEEVLGRSTKRNVILLGEPGIGKASLVYNLALKSLTGQLSENLKYKRFLALDLASLLAQGGGGELEARVKSILEELTHAGNVVVYLPQIENIVGGAGFDISGLLVGALGEDKLQVIATSDRASYKQYIEARAAFTESFEIIDVPETTQEETIRILEGRVGELEKKHKITITFKAIVSTVELANRYLVDRVFPGKALDLLDEVASATSLSKKPVVEASDVERVLTEKTKVPVSFAKGNEAEKLLKLEEILHLRIVSQNEAISSIAESVRRARTLVRTTKRPIGVFLFLGPTGVGKTETAKALAQVYFGSESSIVRLDMSEFQEEEAINRLIGPPPGESGFASGGQLTEAVRKNPFSLVLLDEIEKAHQKVQEAFLAIFDEGRVADASGRLISFTNTIIIATSNAGAEFIREEISSGRGIGQIKPALLEKLQREGIFKPEFLNRFDDVVVYKPLEKTDVDAVTRLMLKDLESRLERIR